MSDDRASTDGFPGAGFQLTLKRKINILHRVEFEQKKEKTPFDATQNVTQAIYASTIFAQEGRTIK